MFWEDNIWFHLSFVSLCCEELFWTKNHQNFPILIKNQNQRGCDSPKRVKSRQIPTLSKKWDVWIWQCNKSAPFFFFWLLPFTLEVSFGSSFLKIFKFFFVVLTFVSSIHHSSPYLISVSFSLHIMSDLKYWFYIEFNPLNLIYRIFDWCMYVFEIAL